MRERQTSLGHDEGEADSSLGHDEGEADSSLSHKVFFQLVWVKAALYNHTACCSPPRRGVGTPGRTDTQSERQLL